MVKSAARIIPAYAGSTARGTRMAYGRRDHPRIRGEHAVGVGHARTLDGSSPHTRGAPFGVHAHTQRAGIIPAYAGSTVRSPRAHATRRDHPRIRGEHVNGMCGFHSVSGSSPHTRGAQQSLQASRYRRRIIPAYAGSTSTAWTSLGPLGDHPRIRGEHDHSRFPLFPRVGSSPHTRGARRPARHPDPRRGIIPAYAGSTASSSGVSAIHVHHPRIRGEHRPCRIAGGGEGGSSPHTRGAQERGQPVSACAGIIPAYAGSTLRTTGSSPKEDGSSPHTRGARRSRWGCRWICRIIPAYAGSTGVARPGRRSAPDHPRIRGEHGPDGSVVAGPGGSSPHTRGALPETTGAHIRVGIIPAYAESTSQFSFRIGSGADHPRIRGEHLMGAVHAQAKTGSSPHTRGALRLVAKQALNTGIIPAYAGSTQAGPDDVRGRPQDHPRIRGEHHLGASICTSASGSSPHTRGALRPAPHSALSSRIIPAYAGSTVNLRGVSFTWWDHPRIRGEHPYRRRRRHPS